MKHRLSDNWRIEKNMGDTIMNNPFCGTIIYHNIKTFKNYFQKIWNQI